MKKGALTILAGFLIVAIMLIPQSFISAQTSTPTIPPPLPTPTMVNPFVDQPPIEQLERGEHIGFRQLKLEDISLVGPFDSIYMSVGVPANWRLSPDSLLTLKVSVNVTQVVDPSGNYHAWQGPRLDVYFDGVFITSLQIGANGDYTFNLPLPVNNPSTVITNGVHSIYIYMDAAYDCELDQSTVVIIKADSYLSLPHENAKLVPDLNLLPSPIYQRSTFLPNEATILVPDRPSDSELQAALLVAAGFGRMSGGSLVLNFIPISQLTEAIQKKTHLIYVGKAASMPAVKLLNLPAPNDGTQFKATGMVADDGIVQMIESPWNPTKAILVVGGNSDAGIVKAAQAVSSGSIRASQNAQLAIVSNVEESIVSQPVVPVDRTFAQLGYDHVTMYGSGRSTTSYTFYLPPGYAVGSDAYLDLYFAHSGLLDVENSSISVILNDIRINDFRFTDQNISTTETPMHIYLPAYAFLPGNNTLRIEVVHYVTYCGYFTTEDLWTTILNNSLLHVPSTTQVTEQPSFPNLGDYPHPFSDDSEMGNLAFVISRNDPVALGSAMKVAANLGQQTVSDVIRFQAYYVDTLPDVIKESMHLIIVGKPTDLSIIAELIKDMPAPFQPNSNIADESGFRVSYRILPETSIGYVELLQAPWSNNRTIMTILGSTSEGVQWAGAALTEPLLRNKLAGNYAVTNGNQVYAVNTLLGSGTRNIGATAVPGIMQTLTPMPGSQMAGEPGVRGTSSSTSIDPKVWIPYAIVVVTLLIIGIIVAVVLINARRKNQRNWPDRS